MASQGTFDIGAIDHILDFTLYMPTNMQCQKTASRRSSFVYIIY